MGEFTLFSVTVGELKRGMAGVVNEWIQRGCGLCARSPLPA